MSPSSEIQRDVTAELVALRAGGRVGRYRISSVLGQGGFGITYRATDDVLGREVAIKEYLPAILAVRLDGTTVVPRSTGAAADFVWGRDRFIVEGRTLAALHHVPGIVLVHDFIETNGTAYLVMELLAGETLQARCQSQGRLDARAIDRIVGVLLDGLEQIHRAGFLHRDIKPANILLDDEERPTLIDFGASRAAAAGRSQAMTAVFTPGYAPVEQFASGPQGPATDIYSLAATLHYAVTGEAPPSAIDRMLDDTYVPLAVRGEASYPPQLLAGIDAGLAVRAADRPQSIAAWRDALSRRPGAADFATVLMHARPGKPKEAVRAPRRRKAFATILAGVVAVVALVGGWVAFAPRPPQPSPPVNVAAVNEAPSRAPDRTQAELDQAVQEKNRAIEEATGLRRDAEARRKAEEEAALRRKIEDELRRKAELDEAAVRQRTADAKSKADADTAAQLAARSEAQSAAGEADRKGATAAEEALHLTQLDRQRLQAALTALGFPTTGVDGVFGPRSREMIAGWQKKSGRPATGYMTSDARTALLREGAAAVTRFDDEQKKSEPPVATTSAAQAPTKGGGSCEGTWPSQWCRDAFQGFPPSCWTSRMTIRNGDISDGWPHQSDRTQRNVITGRINPGGTVTLTYAGIGQQTYVDQHFTAVMTGKVADGVLSASGHSGTKGRDFSVRVQCN